MEPLGLAYRSDVSRCFSWGHGEVRRKQPFSFLNDKATDQTIAALEQEQEQEQEYSQLTLVQWSNNQVVDSRQAFYSYLVSIIYVHSLASCLALPKSKSISTRAGRHLKSSLERKLTATVSNIHSLGVRSNLPVLGHGVPVGKITTGEVGAEDDTLARLDRETVKVPQHELGVVGTTKADVDLWDFLADYAAGVGDVGVDGEEHVVEGLVSTWSNIAASWVVGLWGAVTGALRSSVVQSVSWLPARCLQVGAVDVWVDVVVDAGEVRWHNVFRGVVADRAVGRSCGCLAGGWGVLPSVVRFNFKVGEFECSITQAKAEFVHRCNVLLVKGTVVNKDALGEGLLRRLNAIVGFVDNVSSPLGAVAAPSEGSLASRVCFAVENVGDGISTLLAWNACPYDSRDIWVLVPLVDKDRADGVDDNDSVVALAGDVLDQRVAVVPESKVVAVTLVAVYDDVALAGISVDENNRNTADVWHATSQGRDLAVGVVIGDRLDELAVASDLSLDGLEGSDEVWELRSSGTPAHCESAIVASAVGATIWSVLVLRSIRAKDRSELLLASEGEGTSVLQENSTFDGSLSDVGRVFSLDINVVVDLSVVLRRIEMLESESVLGPRREVWRIVDLVVLTLDIVPGCNDTNGHVIQTPLWDGTVEDGNGQVGSPVALAGVEGSVTRHGHVCGKLVRGVLSSSRRLHLPSPASAELTPECCACQSLTTNPWKPSSPFRSPLRVALFWQP